MYNLKKLVSKLTLSKSINQLPPPTRGCRLCESLLVACSAPAPRQRLRTAPCCRSCSQPLGFLGEKLERRPSVLSSETQPPSQLCLVCAHVRVIALPYKQHQRRPVLSCWLIPCHMSCNEYLLMLCSPN